MTVRSYVVLLVLFLALSPDARAQTLSLRHHDSVVWAQQQNVRGAISGATSGVLLANDEAIPFVAADGAFEVDVTLSELETTLTACTTDMSTCSSSVIWTLGFEPRPEVLLVAEVNGGDVTLRARLLDNPTGAPLSFSWSADAENPAGVALSVLNDSTATVSLAGSPAGEYYINVDVTAGDGSPRRARTFVTVDDEAVLAFDIARDHASWIDSAVVYSIFPYPFAGQASNKLRQIAVRIPELAELGINTIWLQPITQAAEPAGWQGYAVSDYFNVWDVLGTDEDLRLVVDEAHRYGMKVLLDFVPNHSSIDHPYAKDVITHGNRSHYVDFYMRESDGAPYSNAYTTRTVGEMTYIYYFWEDLVTFNLRNVEAQRFLIEAARYWIEEFDIDGYRIDAVWAPHARNPEFMHEWRLALKRIKPEILLLAEDKATRSEAFPSEFPSTFENFDLAYDWSPSSWCISHWSWAYPGDCNYYPVAYGNTAPKYTIFNRGNESVMAANLRRAIMNRDEGYHPDAKIFRFLETNDSPRFIAHHSPAQKRMAAALLFSLHGVPMLYYGQEIGTRAMYPTISTATSIRSLDTGGWWDYYHYLIDLRHRFDALRSDNFEEVELTYDVPRGRTFAYRRWHDDSNIFAALNLGSRDVSVTLTLPIGSLGLEKGRSYYLTDLLSGHVVEGDVESLASIDLELGPHAAVLYALADSVVHVSVSSEPSTPSFANEFVLHPNYPNPFSEQTTLVMEVPSRMQVRYNVFDLLGRRVLSGESAMLSPGRHELPLRTSGLASGVYLLRVEAGGASQSRRLTVVR
jgi:cyclomaltodextrinase / maltogenic alpha-amylase / neopullulanase